VGGRPVFKKKWRKIWKTRGENGRGGKARGKKRGARHDSKKTTVSRFSPEEHRHNERGGTVRAEKTDYQDAGEGDLSKKKGREGKDRSIPAGARTLCGDRPRLLGGGTVCLGTGGKRGGGREKKTAVRVGIKKAGEIRGWRQRKPSENQVKKIF